MRLQDLRPRFDDPNLVLVPRFALPQLEDITICCRPMGKVKTEISPIQLDLSGRELVPGLLGDQGRGTGGDFDFDGVGDCYGG